MSQEKARNILIAGAIGDACGYNVEFLGTQQILKRYGGNVTLDNALDAYCSDDTQMTLFCLEGIKGREYKPLPEICEAIRISYLDWLCTQSERSCQGSFGRQKQLHKLMAPGHTCLSALEAGGAGTMQKPINGSKGCGGAMRAAPCGLLPNLAAQDCFMLGCMQAALTHGHPDGYLPSGFLSCMLRLSLDGAPFGQAFEEARRILQTYPDSAPFCSYLDRCAQTFGKPFASPAEMTELLGEGWTGDEAVGLALHACSAANSFAQAIEISVNHNGDSDSTGSIAGQLYAAFRPIHQRDLDFFSRLDLREILEESLRSLPGFPESAPAISPAGPV